MTDPHSDPAFRDEVDEALLGEPTAEELRSIAEEVASSYPPPRLGTELVLLEVSPNRAHAYWNVEVADFEAAVAASGQDAPAMLLRLHDVTGLEFDGSNAHSYFDVQVQGLQGHWYVDLWQDGRAYIAELGLRRANGSFAVMSRSNRIATPASGESALYNTEALDVLHLGDAVQRLTDLISDPHLSPENMDAETGALIDRNPPPVGPGTLTDPAAYRAPDAAAEEAHPGAAPLQPSVRPAPDAKEFPLAFVPDATPREQIEQLFHRVQESVAAEPPAPVVTPQWTEPSSPPPAAAPAETAGTPATEQQRWPSAEELVRHVPDTSATAPVDAAPAREESHAAPAPAPDSAQQASSPSAPPSAKEALPLDSYVSLSSFEHGRPQVDLEVNVELHIYGRAKPGAKLSFYGQPVALQPDGSFSIRKPLPQGAVVLPLLAVEPPAEPPRT